MPVTDVDDRSEAFCENVIGLRKLFRFGDLTFLDCAGVRLLLDKTAEVSGSSGCIYLRCADIHAAGMMLGSARRIRES
ncbi:MAG: hypothetical protein GEV13_09795 [Rhodospirillales bacterium]|nr:hypothetical protein [Rhodospirillales bacterium]